MSQASFTTNTQSAIRPRSRASHPARKTGHAVQHHGKHGRLVLMYTAVMSRMWMRRDILT
jgi:hypothetical protein